MGTFNPWFWNYTDDEDGVLFCYTAPDDESAREIQERVQSVGGSNIERDGNFLYVIVTEEDREEVMFELTEEGFNVEESV